MSKKKITDEQVIDALEVLKSWVGDDPSNRCLVAFVGDISESLGLAALCGNETGSQSALIHCLMVDERLRRALKGVLGVILRSGMRELTSQLSGNVVKVETERHGEC